MNENLRFHPDFLESQYLLSMQACSDPSNKELLI